MDLLRTINSLLHLRLTRVEKKPKRTALLKSEMIGVKTVLSLTLAAAFLGGFSACTNTQTSHSSSGSAARPRSYGEATEETHERYGGRQLGPHPGAAAYDPSRDR